MPRGDTQHTSLKNFQCQRWNTFRIRTTSAWTPNNFYFRCLFVCFTCRTLDWTCRVFLTPPHKQSIAIEPTKPSIAWKPNAIHWKLAKSKNRNIQNLYDYDKNERGVEGCLESGGWQSVCRWECILDSASNELTKTFENYKKAIFVQK